MWLVLLECCFYCYLKQVFGKKVQFYCFDSLCYHFNCMFFSSYNVIDMVNKWYGKTRVTSHELWVTGY